MNHSFSGSSSSTADDGKEHGTELSLSVSLGPLQLSATRTVSVGRLLAASAYNRHLNQIVKTYGELDGMRVEFAHGRDMLNWEIGMFCTYSSPQDALSIVARHILHDCMSRMTNDDEQNPNSSDPTMTHNYFADVERLVTDTQTKRKSWGRNLSSRAIQPQIGFKFKLPKVAAIIPLKTVQQSIYARYAAAIVSHELRLLETFNKPNSYPRVAASEKTFAIRYFVLLDPQKSDQDKKLSEYELKGDYTNSSGSRGRLGRLHKGGVHIEVRAEKCFIGVSDCTPRQGLSNAQVVKEMFMGELDHFVNNEHDIPDEYFRAIEGSINEGITLGDIENEARIRSFLRTRKIIQRDSSYLYGDEMVLDGLKRCQNEWHSKRVQCREKSGITPKDDASVYHLIRQRLQHNDSDSEARTQGSEHMSRMYLGKLWRRDELSVFADVPDMQRRTGSSVERLWLGSLFDSEDTKNMGWIKRRRLMTFVETFTEYFVVMPVERRVVSWTKRSYYNSLKVPWSSHVRSRMTLSALSSICLLSACVYPSPRPQPDQGLDAGDAVLDRELFEDNVRNAGRGIGYAISRLTEEHREAQLRQSGTWNQAPLKLGSLVSLVHKLLNWLDNESKAWVVRETLTLLYASNVNIVIDPGMSGTLANVMFNTIVLNAVPSAQTYFESSRSSRSSHSSRSSRSSRSSGSNNSSKDRFRPLVPEYNANGCEDYDDYEYDDEGDSQGLNNWSTDTGSSRGRRNRLPLPAVLVDCGMPAGGLYAYCSKERNGTFVLARDNGKNWRYRRIVEQGSRKVVIGKKRQAMELNVSHIDRVDVMSGNDRVF